MTEANSNYNFHYDELSDTLYVTFSEGEAATGIELTEHILLRLFTTDMRVVGLSILDYSILTQQTEMGVRSFPMTGLAKLPTDLRKRVLELLHQPPLREILAISAYTPSVGETIPIISVLPLPVMASVA